MKAEYENLPKTREEAREQDTVQFFTGKPCKNGHLAYRFTKTGLCSVCCKINARRWRYNHKDHLKATSKTPEQRKKNAERQKEYCDKNREKITKYNREYHRQYRKTEHGKERLKAANEKLIARKMNEQTKEEELPKQ